MANYQNHVGLDRPRVRDFGISIGDLPPGPYNTITDVARVCVGHATLISEKGPARTGVTVILPHGGNLFRQKVCAAAYAINGHGKVCGFEEVRELGIIEAPIALTNTFNVGLVADALLQYAMRQDPEIGVCEDSMTLNVVVGETNDSYLNDLPGRHVRAEHVWAAIEEALASPSPGPVAEGVVGAGTGTSCFGWKGGIGTASRLLPAEAGEFTIGALVQSNFGLPAELTICGVPVGRYIQPPNVPAEPVEEKGSIMIVLATDAPLNERQLRRLCVRAAAGLVRTGSRLGHNSGDFVIAFTTACPLAHEAASLTRKVTALADEPKAMQWLFPAVVESVEEAVLNSLFRAETVVGRDGNTRYALPVEQVVEMIQMGSASLGETSTF